MADADASGVSCQGIILDMARQVDEWRGLEKSLGALEREGDETRIDKLVSFCNYYFDRTAVLTVQDERVVRCSAHVRDSSGGNTKNESVGTEFYAGEVRWCNPVKK